MKFGKRFLVLLASVVVFTAVVRCGRDSHIQLTEQKVPNPAAHPIDPRTAGDGDGFGPITPEPDHVKGTRPEMPKIQPAPAVPPPVLVPQVIPPPIPPMIPVVPPTKSM